MHLNHLKRPRQQRGLTMILVLVLLIMTVTASLYFHQRMISSTRMSGFTRDNSASLMLAESAMEMLRGGFINTLDSNRDILDCTTLDSYTLDSPFKANVRECCSVNGASYDSCEAYAVIQSMNNPVQLAAYLDESNLAYMFYVGSTGISQTSPTILQGVANGGATAKGGTFCSVTSPAISAADCNLKINDLFSNGQKPKLYTTNDNGLLVNSTAENWDAERALNSGNDTVAAAWMELTVNPDEASAVDIWVEAIARVGAATSYVQRYVGTYYPTNTLGSLSALIEASNIDRREGP